MGICASKLDVEKPLPPRAASPELVAAVTVAEQATHNHPTLEKVEQKNQPNSPSLVSQGVAGVASVVNATAAVSGVNASAITVIEDDKTPKREKTESPEASHVASAVNPDREELKAPGIETLTPFAPPLNAQAKKTTLGFLSHRGPDVKKQLVEPLHKLLDKLGCHFFYDREDIELGLTNQDAVAGGLYGAENFIIFFTPGFFSSKWCVKELLTIVDRKDNDPTFKDKGKIIPVFIGVDTDLQWSGAADQKYLSDHMPLVKKTLSQIAGIIMDENDTFESFALHHLVPKMLTLFHPQKTCSYTHDQLKEFSNDCPFDSTPYIVKRIQAAAQEQINRLQKQIREHIPKLLEEAQVEEATSIYVPLEYSRSADTEKMTRYPLSNVMESLLGGAGIQLHSSDAKESDKVSFGNPNGSSKSDELPQLLLIQGPAGTGKSLFGWKMCAEWAKMLKEEASRGIPPARPIPLFVSLPKFQYLLRNPAERPHLLFRYFEQTFGLDPQQIKSLHDMRFIFVLDGFDEVNGDFRIWNECHLYEWSRSIFLISSRTGFLKGDSDINSYIVPAALAAVKSQAQLQTKKFAQLHLVYFSSLQADEYIKQYVASGHNEIQWNFSQYVEARNKQPELKELGKEPLTLFMTLRIMPKLFRDSDASQRLHLNSLSVKPAKAVPTPFLHIRRVELYAMFFEDWLDREVNRRFPAKDVNEANSNPFKIKQKNMRDAVRKFSEKLALEMFRNNATSFHANLDEWHKSQPQAQLEDLELMDEFDRAVYLASQSSATPPPSSNNTNNGDAWAMDIFFDENDKSVDAAQKRASAPLRKSGDDYAFLHKSLQEYFSAISMASELVLLVARNKWPQVLHNPEKIRELKITKKLLTDDYAVLRFAAEMVDQRVRGYIPTREISAEEKISDPQQGQQQQFQPFGKALFDLIEASRHFPLEQVESCRLNVAAANAITILNYANVSLAGRDLSKAQLGALPKTSEWQQGTHAFADLNCALLNATNLREANLHGVRLQEASLQFADLRGCNLSNVTVGRGRTLQGHSGGVNCLALSSDGKTLFSGSNDKSIREWNVETGKLKQTLQGHTYGVNCLALSSDGKTLFSGSSDNSIRQWNAETGELKQTLQGHTGGVSCLALSSDGKTLFSGSYDNSIRGWNVETGELKQMLQGHTDLLRSLALSSDGKTLFSGSNDKSIRQWNVETGQLKQTLRGHDIVFCLALSSDGKTLFSGDYSICEWNVDAGHGELKQTLQGHTSAVISLSLSSDGKTLFSGSLDKSIRQWNVETGELKQTLQGHTESVNCLVLSSGGKTLFSAGGNPDSNDNSIRQWNVETGELKQTLQGHTGYVHCLALSSDGKTLFSAGGSFDSNDNSIREWNVETGELKQTLQGHTSYVKCLVLSSDGKTLFSGSNDNSIREWNVETGELKQTLQVRTGSVTRLALSSDGKTLFSAGGNFGYDDKSIRQWNVETGQLNQTLQGHTGSVYCLALSSDGKTLFSGSGDSSIRQWNVSSENSELKQTLQGHTGGVSCLVLSSDGKTLFSGSGDIREWNVETGELKQTLRGHDEGVAALALSSDGKTLFSGSYDNSIREWNVETGQLKQTLQGHTSYVNCLALSSDGKTLFSGSEDKSIRQWNVSSEGIWAFSQTLQRVPENIGSSQLGFCVWSTAVPTLSAKCCLLDDHVSQAASILVEFGAVMGPSSGMLAMLQLNGQLLDPCAYLASQDIPLRLIKNWFALTFSDSEQDTMEATWRDLLDKLQRSCIIMLSESFLSIHEIVLRVIRDLHQSRLKDGTAEWFKRFTALLTTEIKTDDQRPQVEYHRILLPHIKHWLDASAPFAERSVLQDLQLTAAECSLMELGNPNQAKEWYESCLEYDEKRYGVDHVSIATTLQPLANAYGSLGDSHTMKSLLERALKINENHYGSDHFEVAITLTNLANACGALGDPQMMKSMLERALAIKEKHCEPDHYQVAITLDNLANACGELGDPQTKKSLLERALALKEKHYGPDHYQVAITLTNLANAYGELGDPQTKKSLLERALKINKNHYGPDHFQVAITRANLGSVCNQLGDHQTAKSMLETALKIIEKHYGADSYQVASTLTNLGHACNRLGDHQTAKPMLERALKIFENHYGADHSQVAITLTSLASAYGALGDPQTKKSMLERALKINEKLYGSDHFEVAITLTNLASAYGELGDPQTKKSMLERALKINENHYGADSYQVASTLTNLASAYGELGDPQTKKSMLERALKINENHYGADHHQVAIILINLGCVCNQLGDPQTAKSMLERALKINEKHYGPDHYQVAITLTNLATVYGELGDIQTKILVLERALKIIEKHYGADSYLASTLTNLANAYRALGDLQTMKSMLERALRVEENHYGYSHFQVAITLTSLATACGPHTAESLLERALAINERHYGPDHYQVAITLANLANAYGALGDPQAMKSLLERALRIIENHYGPDHFEVAITLTHLANAYGALGDPQTMKSMLERALKINKNHYGPDHYQVAITLQRLAAAYEALGDTTHRWELLRRVLPIYESHYGYDHTHSNCGRKQLAEAEHEKSNHEEAVEEHGQTDEDLRRTFKKRTFRKGKRLLNKENIVAE